MTSLGVQITKRIKESREHTPIQAGKLLLHICIPLMVWEYWVKMTIWVQVEKTKEQGPLEKATKISPA